ncbi:zinc dependent phospholipase C family protein [Dethiothermospora halolimnae]|uniref:zinc dependent phospholipase C family protein n=1 Tax=Dethiothermospora halolimnae TaxID=3114390 RepID=UPI003CCBD270
MANWITHLRIVDNLFKKGIDLDEKGFVIGNVAPDCNVENEDWTKFTPSREVTHWMKKKRDKLSADYEGFYNKYIEGLQFDSCEKISFLLGYYSHLITDVQFQKFVRDDERVKNIFCRVKNRESLYERVKGYPENFDTLKEVFGKQNILTDIHTQEYNYLKNNPKSKYNTILKKVKEFPDYLDYFPKGAIIRKIGIMTEGFKLEEKRKEFIFFTEKELNHFVDGTSNLIYELISNLKLIKNNRVVKVGKYE